MVKGHRHENLGAEMVAGHFSILSGVLPNLGGGDEGPNPHELLEAALAGCTIITCQMYANRKQLKLRSTIVEIKIESETKEATKILRRIDFVGDLTAEEKKRLFEIADKCPIHHLLQSQVTIVTEQLPTPA
jgi:putative redox protein